MHIGQLSKEATSLASNVLHVACFVLLGILTALLETCILAPNSVDIHVLFKDQSIAITPATLPEATNVVKTVKEKAENLKKFLVLHRDQRLTTDVPYSPQH